MDDEIFYDLYLYTVPESDKLTKIPHLSMADAKRYSKYWFDMNEMHDYMLVTEGSTPWSEPIPIIKIKDTNWIISEYEKLNRL